MLIFSAVAIWVLCKASAPQRWQGYQFAYRPTAGLNLVKTTAMLEMRNVPESSTAL
jgi:hypothetical protein